MDQRRGRRDVSEGQNGDRLNRQIKATEAYANLTRDIADLRHELFGDLARPGILIEIHTDLKALRRNPMVRLGVQLGTTRRVAARSRGCVRSARTAPAKAGALRSLTTMPASIEVTISGTPPTSVAITGVPHAIASSSTLGQPSRLDARTSASAAQ